MRYRNNINLFICTVKLDSVVKSEFKAETKKMAQLTNSVLCYKKNLSNFNISEWRCLASSLKVDKEKLKLTKTEIIYEVFQKNADLLQRLESFHFFEQSGKQLKLLASEPSDVDKYLESKINYLWYIKPEDLRQIADNENGGTNALENDSHVITADDDDVQETVSHVGGMSQHEANSIHENVKSISPATSKVLSQKIKYDPKQEIQRFLSQIETYASVHGINDDKTLISIAIAALDQCDEGSLAKESLREEDKINWQALKSKLVSLLGHRPDYYRGGLALSCLSQAFKRGWQINRPLTVTEEQMIITAFINSLEGSLKVLLKSEERNLNFSNIAERAQELEDCLGKDQQINMLTLGPSAVDTINAIQPKSTQIDELISLMTRQHKEMMQIISADNFHRQFRHSDQPNHSRNYSQGSNSYKKPANFRGPNPLSAETKSAIGNLCIRYIKGKPCNNSNCRWEHSGPISSAAKDAIIKK